VNHRVKKNKAAHARTVASVEECDTIRSYESTRAGAVCENAYYRRTTAFHAKPKD